MFDLTDRAVAEKTFRLISAGFRRGLEAQGEECVLNRSIADYLLELSPRNEMRALERSMGIYDYRATLYRYLIDLGAETVQEGIALLETGSVDSARIAEWTPFGTFCEPLEYDAAVKGYPEHAEALFQKRVEYLNRAMEVPVKQLHRQIGSGISDEGGLIHDEFGEDARTIGEALNTALDELNKSEN